MFGLSIYTATTNFCTVGNEKVLLGLFWRGFEVGSKKKVLLSIIAGNMKICTYFHVRNNLYEQDVS
jgi:hypothetical protein